MKSHKFTLNSIAMSVLLATSPNLFAQEAGSDETEIINVTGIRGSLASSANIKRSSSGVVDAITAEDIGKFPDTNLAESLQRITGVSIDRANNEGSQVTVRGFGPNFNLVTLNGRQMPTSSVQNANRSFNFREIAAESVRGVEVHKTGKSNISSGGIGANINVQTAKPFDYGEFKAFASAQGVVDTSVEKGSSVTPEISGMVSNVFMDGKVGVLFSASHSERDSHRDRIGTDGWVRNRGNRSQIDTSAIDTSKNPEQAFWNPWTAVVEHYDTERERQNAQLVLQLAPTDNIVASFDYTMSRFEEASTTNRSAYWFDDPFGTADANGTVINPFDPDDELNFWAWEYYEKKENDSLGLNIEWQATESLKFSLDAHDSKSHANPDGIYERIANLKNPKFDGNGVDIGANFSGEIPAITVDDSKIPGSAYDKANLVSDLYQERGLEMENQVKQIHLAGIWENMEDGALANIHFGFQQTDYQVDTYRSGSFFFVNVPLTNLDLTFIPLGDTGDQFSGADQLFPLVPQYSANQFIDIVKAEGQFGAPNITTNGITEKTDAIYVKFDFQTEFNEMPVDMNVGVRYEKTDVSAYSVQDGIVALNYRNVEELEVIDDNIQAAQSLDGGYSRILPNFDLSLEATDDIVTRFSYSRTIGRPGIGSMFPGTSLNAPRPEGPFRASQGNPSLLPLTSDNFDLSVEWYGEDGSTASITYYKKFVENFIGTGTENRVINNVNGEPLTDPSVTPRPGCPDSGQNTACFSQASDPVITWEVTTPLNLQDRKIDGWELNAQYFFGETGFGAVANYTIVNSDETFDLFNFSQSAALTGLSDSGNLVGFYENEELQVRLAYNWRDDFLQALGNEPTFVEAYGQWDLSVSYDVNETMSVFIDGINLTNETVRRHGRFAEQVLDAEQYGPRFNIGVRAKF
ncbi:TonB-dependent receptor [Paraglaciecola aquimarina]|uniref:TonB-dependent receptor n=1 Tax=Paraglaciecola algarum TaxID=3050085 RepID=A0ABS9D2Z7_9ALTE|nr:TonB-dependent receptor [Paraglaciecola sp. G1-23]MCF2946984.1 TonB-dependent receptor [Paraglaciecola sp. G1-23]